MRFKVQRGPEDEGVAYMIQLKPELLQRRMPLRVQALIEVELVVQEHACLKSGVHV